MKKKNKTIQGHLTRIEGFENFEIGGRLIKDGDRLTMYLPTGNVAGGHPELRACESFLVVGSCLKSKISGVEVSIVKYINKYFSIV